MATSILFLLSFLSLVPVMNKITRIGARDMMMEWEGGRTESAQY